MAAFWILQGINGLHYDFQKALECSSFVNEGMATFGRRRRYIEVAVPRRNALPKTVLFTPKIDLDFAFSEGRTRAAFNARTTYLGGLKNGKAWTGIRQTCNIRLSHDGEHARLERANLLGQELPANDHEGVGTGLAAISPTITFAEHLYNNGAFDPAQHGLALPSPSSI